MGINLVPPAPWWNFAMSLHFTFHLTLADLQVTVGCWSQNIYNSLSQLTICPIPVANTAPSLLPRLQCCLLEFLTSRSYLTLIIHSILWVFCDVLRCFSFINLFMFYGMHFSCGPIYFQLNKSSHIFICYDWNLNVPPPHRLMLWYHYLLPSNV